MFFFLFHAIAEIAETLILSFDCVEPIHREGLSYVVCLFFDLMYNENSYCVELALETLTEQGLPNQAPYRLG